MPCAISISGCFRTKSATSAPERSTKSWARSRASPCAVRPASASSAPTAWRCFAERSPTTQLSRRRRGACARRGRRRSIWSWAVDRVLAADDPLEEARAIHDEQIAIDAAIAENGLELIAEGRAHSHALQHRVAGDRRRRHGARRHHRGAARREEAARLRKRNASAAAGLALELSGAAAKPASMRC